MSKLISIGYAMVLSLLLFSCNQTKEASQRYEDQVGDTHFNPKIDNPDFNFCDSTDVLHKRAQVRYKGGRKALQEELSKNYEIKPSYKSYSGYFIVRFAVNCKGEAGRFRIEGHDSDFNLAKCPDELEVHIRSLVKNLKHWRHAFYHGKDYDCYSFFIIKIENGQIQQS